MIKYFLITLSFLHINSMKIGNRCVSKQQLQKTALFLNSKELQAIYQIKFNDAKEYIIDLETLKFVFKNKKIPINTKLFAHILSSLPNKDTQEANDLATYLTLSYQIKNSAKYSDSYASKELLQKIKQNFIRSFIVWKISNKQKSKAEKIRNQLDLVNKDEYKIIATASDNFTEFKMPIMNFQLNTKSSYAIQSTIKGNFSDIIFENGEYTFFYIVDSIIIDSDQYLNLIKEEYKKQFMQDQIRLYKPCISIEG
ncbi:hypothetical protein [Candidatus Cytomitobacter primus]|uniref:Uncharacterized protein n=1 Tax=Candidatus Cytomitobacter primus TaxID=2066024 RepID=A0A5C0UFK8_9PROT|nr:hypothetical protein [Candidatus Cytomitobacter primus]QEK38500.1 hypothetical protein FZC34_01075 [Candidatus Cytomitobacter primus]